MLLALPLTLWAGGSAGDEAPGDTGNGMGDTTMNDTMMNDTGDGMGDTTMNDTMMNDTGNGMGDTTMNDTMMNGTGDGMDDTTVNDTMMNDTAMDGNGWGRTDKDGAAEAGAMWMYQNWDQNTDGYIDSSEFMQQWSQLGLEQRLGLGEDSTISRDSLKAELFTLWDNDGDSTIDSTEFAQQLAWLGEEQPAMGNGGDMRGNGQEYGDGSANPLEAWDNDGDGMLSKQEFTEYLDLDRIYDEAGIRATPEGGITVDQLGEVVYGVIDEDNDGRLNQSEWEQARQSWESWYTRTAPERAASARK